MYFAALTSVSLLKMGLDFWLAFLTLAGGDGRAGLLTERIVVAAARESTSGHAVAGSRSAHARHRGLAQLLWARSRTIGRHGIQDEPLARWISDSTGMSVSSSTLRRPGSLPVVATSLALFQPTRGSAATLPRVLLDYPRLRLRGHSAAADLGDYVGMSQASSRWWRGLLWGARNASAILTLSFLRSEGTAC